MSLRKGFGIAGRGRRHCHHRRRLTTRKRFGVNGGYELRPNDSNVNRSIHNKEFLTIIRQAVIELNFPSRAESRFDIRRRFRNTYSTHRIRIPFDAFSCPQCQEAQQ